MYNYKFKILLLFFVINIYSCKKNSINSVETNGIVSSIHPLASEVGINILKKNGNAVDAAIATGLALGVVDQFNSGLGGGAFIMIRLSNGKIFSIDGREKAPAKATQKMYNFDGKINTYFSQNGPLSIAVPGLPAAYIKALNLAGTKKLAELIKPSINIAKNGFKLDDDYIRRYKINIDELRKDSSSKKIYFNSKGEAFKTGHHFVQNDLANTYEKFGEKGINYFYKGEFADKLVKFMEENGGLITHDDMKNYNAILREPVEGKYRNYKIYGMGPPSSGGINIVQMLNMIEMSGVLKGKDELDKETIYMLSLIMGEIFKSRSNDLGDPDFNEINIKQLLSKSFAEKKLLEIKHKETVLKVSKNQNLKSGHTTNLCVIDKWGNSVVINQTVNHTFGSKVTVPGSGVILNNEMDDFSIEDGLPNAFGLTGGEINSIEGNKRPLSSMSPTIVTKNDKPIIIIGGAGGPRIITSVLQLIINIIDFDLSIEEAISAPRFHHQFLPEAIFVEKGFSNEITNYLEKKGFDIIEKEKLGIVNIIGWDSKNKKFIGLSDTRVRKGKSSRWY